MVGVHSSLAKLITNSEGEAFSLREKLTVEANSGRLFLLPPSLHPLHPFPPPTHTFPPSTPSFPPSLPLSSLHPTLPFPPSLHPYLTLPSLLLSLPPSIPTFHLSLSPSPTYPPSFPPTLPILVEGGRGWRKEVQC